MKAIGIENKIGMNQLGSNLKLLQVPRPIPKKGELLIKVKASTINIDDIHEVEGSMMGGFRTKPVATRLAPVVPGTELSGIVETQGEGADKFPVGTPIYGICSISSRFGPWAEYCIVKENNVFEIPANFNFKQICPFPLSATLAAKCLEIVNNPGEATCLIIGASGGIGSFCVQAMHRHGANVMAICSIKNAALVKSLGASKVLAYDDTTFQDKLQEIKGKVDIVFDFVGGSISEKNGFNVLKRGGSFVTIVGPEQWVGQRKLNAIQLFKMFGYIGWRMISAKILKGKAYKFVAYKTPPSFAKIQKLLLSKKIYAQIDSTIQFSEKEIKLALQKVLNHQTAGRVVIDMQQ